MVEYSATVERWKPKFPFLLAIASQRAPVSKKPEALSPRPRARSRAALTPSRRRTGPAAAVASSKAGIVGIVLRAEALDLLGVGPRRGHQGLAPGHRLAEQRLVELVGRRRAALAALAAGDRDRDGPDHAGGRDVVGGEPGVPGLRQPERHLALGGLGEREDPVGERSCLIAGPAHLRRSSIR